MDGGPHRRLLNTATIAALQLFTIHVSPLVSFGLQVAASSVPPRTSGASTASPGTSPFSAPATHSAARSRRATGPSPTSTALSRTAATAGATATRCGRGSLTSPRRCFPLDQRTTRCPTSASSRGTRPTRCRAAQSSSWRPTCPSGVNRASLGVLSGYLVPEQAVVYASPTTGVIKAICEYNLGPLLELNLEYLQETLRRVVLEIVSPA